MLRQYFHTMFFRQSSRRSSEAWGHKRGQGSQAAWLPPPAPEDDRQKRHPLDLDRPSIPELFPAAQLQVPSLPCRSLLWSHDYQVPLLRVLVAPESGGRAHRPHAGQVGAWARKGPGYSGAAASAG